VNVAAIPKELIESELFGHEKGSFTGANFRRIENWRKPMAEHCSSMKWRRWTSHCRLSFCGSSGKEIIRIGVKFPVKTDCRIIIATNKNLLEEVKTRKFQADLYYRLYGLPIELPPLRERGNDVIILAKQFIDLFCRENNLPAKVLSADASNRCFPYSFPGMYAN
jgi:transcriptional regulator with GAF, ATPase, and Fis domain